MTVVGWQKQEREFRESSESDGRKKGRKSDEREKRGGEEEEEEEEEEMKQDHDTSPGRMGKGGWRAGVQGMGATQDWG